MPDVLKNQIGDRPAPLAQQVAELSILIVFTLHMIIQHPGIIPANRQIESLRKAAVKFRVLVHRFSGLPELGRS